MSRVFVFKFRWVAQVRARVRHQHRRGRSSRKKSSGTGQTKSAGSDGSQTADGLLATLALKWGVDETGRTKCKKISDSQ